MASLRKRYRISWDDGEPVEIRTSARDTLNFTAEDRSSQERATFALLHAALVREGHEPPPIEEWIDLVDEVEPVGTEVVGVEGPTPLTVSDGELSPLPASPAATTGRSSKRTTTAPSKRQSKS